MRYKPPFLLALMAAVVTAVAWAPRADAFNMWSDGCVTCHGPYRTGTYVSFTDGTSWGTNLHTGHQNFGIACSACHGSFPPALGGPSGDGFNACSGCHGRDETDDGVANSSALGLREHHRNKGANTCGSSSCHAGDAALGAPVPENVQPRRYPSLNWDACDANSSESRFGSFGLDNDGDLTYDGNDSDCQVVVNDPPVANPDSASTAVNTPVTIDVLANDTDTDGPDALTVSGIFAGTDTNGTVVNNTTNVSYTPNNDFCGTATFEYTAFDGLDDSNLALVTVAVGDTNPPAITGPVPAALEIISDVPVSADDPTIAAWLASATATDPEEGPVTVTNDAPPSFPLGTTTVIFTATDSCGNVDTATGTVTVTPPSAVTCTVTAPTPDPLQVTAPLCATSVTRDATADNFAGTIGEWLLTASAVDSEGNELPVDNNAPTDFPLGDTLVTFDAATADATCSAEATVSVAETPNDAPVLTVPADLSLTVPAGTVSVPATDPAIADWLASATASDAQDGDLTAAITNDAPADFPVNATTTVTFTVADACGLDATATANVTITEEGVVNTPPVVTAPDPFTYEAFFCATSVSAEDQAIAIWLSLATATDAEDGLLPVTNDAPAEFPAAPAPGVTTTVTFTATDSGGLTDTATSTLTVVDTNNAPVVTAPAPLTTADPTEIAAWLASATATDAEDGTLGVTNDAPAVFPEGTTTVTFSATDSCGATTTATSTVTLVGTADVQVNVFVKRNVDLVNEPFLKAYFWREDMDIIATLNTTCTYKDNPPVSAVSGRRDDFNGDGFVDSLGRFPPAEFGFECTLPGQNTRSLVCEGELRDGRRFFGTSNLFYVTGLVCE